MHNVHWTQIAANVFKRVIVCENVVLRILVDSSSKLDVLIMNAIRMKIRRKKIN